MHGHWVLDWIRHMYWTPWRLWFPCVPDMSSKGRLGQAEEQYGAVHWPTTLRDASGLSFATATAGADDERRPGCGGGRRRRHVS